MSTNFHGEIDYEELFGSDSGENEDPTALKDYFVDLPEFKKFYNEEKPLIIVRGRKGMGKSALLRRLAIQLKDKADSKNIIIETTGNELIGMGDFSGANQAYLENHWKQVICKRICVEIGKKINLAFTDNSMSLVESAEMEGFKGTNVVSALTERMGGFLQSVLASASPGAKIDLAVKKKGVINPLQSLKTFQEEKNHTVWLLIDDVDAKYVDNEEFQQRIGAFFSAIRSIGYSVQGLKIRASVRTDVWKNLRKMEDQDKIRGYVIDISWKDSTLRSIFAKRILSYLQRKKFTPSLVWDPHINYDNIVKQFFRERMPWDNKKVEPFIPIKILAGNRPRWMGQLCKLAGEKANGGIICIEDLTYAMKEFGQEKISDIQKEHIHQFSDLPKVIDIFRSGKREYNRFQLISLIENSYVKKVGGVVPSINGYPYLKEDQIAEFLFQIDFLSAHHLNKSDFSTYEHNPDIFSSNENQQNKLQWTINASYRNHLRIV